MLTRFLLFLIPSLIVPVLSSAPVAHAQAPTSFSSYAAVDYKAHKSSPFSSPKWDPFVKEGFEAMDRDDIPSTIEFLRKALNFGCRSPLVTFKLALAFESQGSYYSAIQYYELARESFKQGNQDHRYYREFNENYGRALYTMGQMDKALPILEKAAQKSDNPGILKLLGQIHLTRGDHLKATSYYMRLLSISDSGLTPEERLEINLLLARTYSNQNEVKAAMRYYEAVLAIDPMNQEARRYMSEKQQSESFEKMFELIE